MTTRRHRDFLKSQLVETQRLEQLAGGHPVLSIAYRRRREDVEQQLRELPVGKKEARAVLLFSGQPVQGSVGIDASFAGRVLEPFQNMVMADYADRWHGTVGSRGRRTGEDHSRLLLTALPRGSFGLELTKAENDELFEEDQLADTLAHVTKLVESAARSDEDFAAELDDTAPRVIQNLKDFLCIVAKGNAGLCLETGDYRCSMNPVEAREAFDRAAGTITREEPLQTNGVFKGILLESWRFDFVDENGHKISGSLEDNLTQEEAANLAREFFDRQCVASLLKTTVVFKNGRVRTTYRLQGLSTAF